MVARFGAGLGGGWRQTVRSTVLRLSIPARAAPQSRRADRSLDAPCRDHTEGAMTGNRAAVRLGGDVIRRMTRHEGDAVSDKKPMVLYAAAYQSVSDAMSALDDIEQLHKDKALGSYDAAVIDKEGGKPHIHKRMDSPRIRIIPEQLGSGALPRKELKEAAETLTGDQAGLIAVGEPTIEKAVDQALVNAAKVVKRSVDAETGEITSELQEALKG
jgi:hypothetical protein